MDKRSLLLCLALVGCAAPGGKKLDAKVANETEVSRPADLHEEISQLIKTEPGLSDVQRARLLQLQANTIARTSDLRDHSLRLRSLLMEELLSPGYDADEVGLIKGRLKKIEKQRLALLFDSVEQANQILGHDGNGHEEMMKRIFELRATEDGHGGHSD